MPLRLIRVMFSLTSSVYTSCSRNDIRSANIFLSKLTPHVRSDFYFLQLTEFTTEATFAPGKKNRGIRLVLDGYSFYKYLNNEDGSRWRCADYKNSKAPCQTRVITRVINGREMISILFRPQHLHPPHDQ